MEVILANRKKQQQLNAKKNGFDDEEQNEKNMANGIDFDNIKNKNCQDPFCEQRKRLPHVH